MFVFSDGFRSNLLQHLTQVPSSLCDHNATLQLLAVQFQQHTETQYTELCSYVETHFSSPNRAWLLGGHSCSGRTLDEKQLVPTKLVATTTNDHIQ